QESKVTLAIAVEFGRHRVGSQERRDQLERPFGVELANDFQALDLVGERQAVATFNFDRGDAEAEQRLEAASGQYFQIIRGGLTHTPHGSVDAASSSCDFLIAPTLQAVFELVFP